jgi:nucleotide-binding universal stress UspA family protein
MKTVIWATDGSAGAEAAFGEAARLGELAGAHILALHVDQRLAGRAAEWPALADEEDRRDTIRRQVASLWHEGYDVELVVHRSHREAADIVALEAAERKADVIVCGTRGLGALPGAFLGSFTHRLLHLAPCPVLAVREGREHVSADENLAVGTVA